MGKVLAILGISFFRHNSGWSDVSLAGRGRGEE
jgi:hypothetical protein